MCLLYHYLYKEVSKLPEEIDFAVTEFVGYCGILNNKTNNTNQNQPFEYSHTLHVNILKLQYFAEIVVPIPVVLNMP